MNLRSFFSKERELRMVWKVLKGGRKSFLVGTAHFFPYSFKNSLRRYISNMDIILVEGPLDDNAVKTVAEHGLSRGKQSLYDALDAQTINKINRGLTYPSRGLSSFASYMNTFKTSGDLLFEQIKDKRPWMAFFSIWFHYLEKKGWRFSTDLDALRIAVELGKEVQFLEKIEEQIEALNGVSLERIVNFLKKIERWDKYARRYVKYYLRGDLEGLMSAAREFPTFCESIINKRDPILHERMKPSLEKGDTIAFVGITHIQGIKKRLLEDGYTFL